MFFFMFLIGIFISKSNQFSETTCQVYFPKCKCFRSDDLICDNFEKFQELEFNTSRIVKFLSFVLRNPLRIDKKLNFSKLLFHDKLTLSLSNVDGFDFNFNLDSPISKLTNPTLQIYNSSIQFYFNENELLNVRCSRLSIDPKYFPFFSSFRNILFDNIKFINKICPFIFQNSNIERLVIKNIGLGNESKMEFLSVIDSSINRLNSTINRLEIESSNIEKIDQNFLPEQIFGNLRELVFTNSEIELIGDQFFKNTPNLQILIFSLNNFEYFIRKQKNSWLKSLNPNSIGELMVGFVDLKEEFKFSDHDFCSFYEFPHEKNVFAYVKSSASLECSCTLVWLFKNYRQSNQSSLILSSESVFDCLTSPEFTQKLLDCNFENRVNQCSNIKNKYVATQLILSFSIIILVGVVCFLVFKFKLVRRIYFKIVDKVYKIEYYHSINLSQTIPVFYENKTIATNFDKLTETIDSWFKKGIISQAKSAQWSLPIKSCEKFAFVDFRELNNICVKTDLFNIEDLTKKLLNSKKFSKIQINDFDLKIKLNENSKFFTSFNCQMGQFQFNFVPSGLATFYHAIKDYLSILLKEHINKRCFVFFDSIIVFSKNEIEHHKLLADIIDKLDKSKLSISKDESFFNKTEIRFNKNVIEYGKCNYNFKTINLINSIDLPNSKAQLKRYLAFFSIFKSKIDRYDQQSYLSILEQPFNFVLDTIQKDHLINIRHQVINLISINLNNLNDIEVHIHLRKKKTEYLLIMFGKIEKNDIYGIPVLIRKEHIKTYEKLTEVELIFKVIYKVLKTIKRFVFNKKFKLLFQNYNIHREAFRPTNPQYLELILKTQHNNFEIKNLNLTEDYEEFLNSI